MKKSVCMGYKGVSTLGCKRIVDVSGNRGIRDMVVYLCMKVLWF
jgi:hypothetical protein